MPSRNFSRSSGVICSQRCIMRRLQYMCPPGPPRKPPKRILVRTKRPRACEKLMLRHPKSDGVSQFHRLMTTKPSTRMAAAANDTNFNLLTSQYRFISLSFRKFDVDILEAFAQMEYSVVLARKQSVHPQA